MNFSRVHAQFDEEATSSTERSVERKQNQVRYRGFLPAPGDGMLGGFEPGGEYSPYPQSDRRDIGQKIANGELNLHDIPYLFAYAVNFVTKAAGVIAVGVFVWTGFLLVMLGSTDKKENAKNAFKFAIIGMIVTFSAWLIVGTIQIQMTSGLGLGDGYTLEDTLWDAMGTPETLPKYALEFPVEYPAYLPGAGEDRLKGDATDFTSWMQNLIGAMTILVSSVAIFFLVENGLRMVISTGNPDTIEKIKISIRWIFGGILLIIFSYVIVKTAISLPYMGQNYSIPKSLTL